MTLSIRMEVTRRVMARLVQVRVSRLWPREQSRGAGLVGSPPNYRVGNGRL